MEIYLARAQGFCSGVDNAIKIVNDALAPQGSPIYVYHEIVHNTYVVNDFKQKGVTFVDDIDQIPEGSRVIFSAHGVPPSLIAKAKERQLECIDATCPLVKKIHNEAVRYSQKEVDVILIGHKGHQEMIGTAGYVAPHLMHVIQRPEDIDTLSIDPGREVTYLTQTTLSVEETRAIIDKLKEKFPRFIGPYKDNICYATQKRQEAIRELAGIVDLIIVCGSPNSSNSNRLRETGEKSGVASWIIDSADDLDMGILRKDMKVGISSGASVPSCIMDQLLGKLLKEYPGSKIIHLKE